MNQSYQKIIAVSVVVLVLAVVFGIMIYFMARNPGDVMVHEGPDVLLDSLQTGANRVQFYVDYGEDSAVLGFFVKDQTGHPRYFPMYCSTYRGLPPVKLDVFLSDTKKEMWVLSSWPGYEVLARYHVGSDRCMTRYGENAAFNTPTPRSMGGGTGHFPDMDPAHARKVLTVTHGLP